MSTQNTIKQVMIVAFHRQGSVREAQQFAASVAAAGKMRYALRYLGPYLTSNNSLRVEGTKRLEAINRNWVCSSSIGDRLDHRQENHVEEED